MKGKGGHLVGNGLHIMYVCGVLLLEFRVSNPKLIGNQWSSLSYYILLYET